MEGGFLKYQKKSKYLLKAFKIERPLPIRTDIRTHKGKKPDVVSYKLSSSRYQLL